MREVRFGMGKAEVPRGVRSCVGNDLFVYDRKSLALGFRILVSRSVEIF